MKMSLIVFLLHQGRGKAIITNVCQEEAINHKDINITQEEQDNTGKVELSYCSYGIRHQLSG